MIKIIRLVRIDENNPAGDIVEFDSLHDEDDVQNTLTYLWGKDISNYLVVKNGFVIELYDGNLNYAEIALSIEI